MSFLGRVDVRLYKDQMTIKPVIESIGRKKASAYLAGSAIKLFHLSNDRWLRLSSDRNQIRKP